ncbi:hypothetical protein GE061_003981 [Apolygus lucorum]|uniref:Uncharacterized protein n=1 Tax=Apolygus lucorum TaxID=248454 RepID=A0A8S9WZE1_APOLU|nr:hypothetical protein GE061_003981 [Apolygus lucorum]
MMEDRRTFMVLALQLLIVHQIWINVAGEHKRNLLARNRRWAIYLDSEGNPCFEGEYLEELPDLATPDLQQPHHIEQPSREQLPEWKPLKSVTNDIVLGKFNGKNCNASTWLTTLETECARLEIPEERYCEVIRLFIEGPVTDWWGRWVRQPTDAGTKQGIRPVRIFLIQHNGDRGIGKGLDGRDVFAVRDPVEDLQ